MTNLKYIGRIKSIKNNISDQSIHNILPFKYRKYFINDVFLYYTMIAFIKERPDGITAMQSVILLSL